ncbi:MAG: hypothetical protein AAGE84_12445 [Cyanobacteria bacterium P01_G01_bin.39]
MVAQIVSAKHDQGYVLRIKGNGGILVEDIYKCLNDLEYAYNSAYVLKSITQQAKELSKQYSNQQLPIPLRNLLWASWWPPNPEITAAFVPDEDRLKLHGVELHSPGFWDFLGKLSPLTVILDYLNLRHEQRKDRVYREPAEAEKLRIENWTLELDAVEKQLKLLIDMGATPHDLSILRDQLIKKSLKRLDVHQDQGLISNAEIVDPEAEKKKRK